ncbi:MAG: PEP-CTERM sorting domain-containing protein [Pseudomonadota bacterium]
MKIYTKILGVFVLSAAALSAQASVVTSLPGGTALVIPATHQTGFFGPATLAPGVTFSSSQPSAYGYTGTYGFNLNGTWSGTPMIGLDRGTGTFVLSFASGISGFLGELNWTTGNSANASIGIYDAANNLLESLTLESGGINQVAPGFYGFSRATNDIASIHFNEEYIGVRNILIVEGGSDVPEPASLALMALGLAGCAVARKKSAQK